MSPPHCPHDTGQYMPHKCPFNIRYIFITVIRTYICHKCPFSLAILFAEILHKVEHPVYLCGPLTIMGGL